MLEQLAAFVDSEPALPTLELEGPARGAGMMGGGDAGPETHRPRIADALRSSDWRSLGG
jgi:hypothetical protein